MLDINNHINRKFVITLLLFILKNNKIDIKTNFYIKVTSICIISKYIEYMCEKAR